MVDGVQHDEPFGGVDAAPHRISAESVSQNSAAVGDSRSLESRGLDPCRVGEKRMCSGVRGTHRGVYRGSFV